MEWLKSLFRKPEPVSPVASQPTVQELAYNLARERAAVLSQKDWVDEQLAQYPIERLLEINGIREAHIQVLRNAGITNLRLAKECHKLPLMGGTADWAYEWLRNFVLALHREYRQHHKALENIARSA